MTAQPTALPVPGSEARPDLLAFAVFCFLCSQKTHGSAFVYLGVLFFLFEVKVK